MGYPLSARTAGASPKPSVTAIALAAAISQTDAVLAGRQAPQQARRYVRPCLPELAGCGIIPA